MMGETPLLRLRAEDADDLQVLSAAVQDSLFRVGEIAYDPRARRFTLMIDRFRWETADGAGPYERVRSGVHFEGVLGVRSRALRRDAPDAAAWLLSVVFEPDPEPPGGVVSLVLAGGGEIRLQVECLDVMAADVGPSWRTPRKPNHDRDRQGE